MECSAEYDSIYKNIKSNWDRIAKPLDSLGKLEDLVAKLGAIQRTEHPSCKKTCLIVLCADNGIVEEGISQSDQSVTRICAENIAAKKTTVGIMAGHSDCEMKVYDVGINYDGDLNNVIGRKISCGTRNFLKEKSMTADEVDRALQIGKEIVSECKSEGFDLICVGEMGIGNTTTSAAIACSLLKMNAKDIAGRGAGLSDEGLARKINVIDKAIEKYGLYDCDARTVLESVGGFDIAVMAGIYLAASEFFMPVVIDGAISLAAALVAERICPGTTAFLIPSHRSRERMVNYLCREMKLSPVIDGDMALGEGTGAVLLLNVLKTAVEVYEKSVPFSESNVDQYTRFK